MKPLNFESLDAISFDCYGTLIDWETGILTAIKPVLSRHKVVCPDGEILRLYGETEPKLQQGEFLSYGQVLRGVMGALAHHFAFRPNDTELDCLVSSLPHWRPFPDTVGALAAMKKRYRLAIVSNIDQDLFRSTAQQLQVPFDQVITAQEVRSYKPALRHFEVLLERLRLPPERVLHVAASLYHDIAPATRLGLPNVWVKRPRPRSIGPSSLSASAPVEPDLIVSDLAGLAERMRLQG